MTQINKKRVIRYIITRIAEGIERGVYVTTDTVLGFVGNNGNVESIPYHLHFGIYPEQ